MKELVDEKLKLIESDFTSDQQISSLSVGQREQVAIVTALLQNPKLLILDEPTASLSSREIEKLFEVIGKLKKEGVTVKMCIRDSLRGQDDLHDSDPVIFFRNLFHMIILLS